MALSRRAIGFSDQYLVLGFTGDGKDTRRRKTSGRFLSNGFVKPGGKGVSTDTLGKISRGHSESARLPRRHGQGMPEGRGGRKLVSIICDMRPSDSGIRINARWHKKILLLGGGA